MWGFLVDFFLSLAWLGHTDVKCTILGTSESTLLNQAVDHRVLRYVLLSKRDGSEVC